LGLGRNSLRDALGLGTGVVWYLGRILKRIRNGIEGKNVCGKRNSGNGEEFGDAAF